LSQEQFEFGLGNGAFSQASPGNKWERPLADRMRPTTLDEFSGQEHLIGHGSPLRKLLEVGKVPCCILYGPPGVGKTTLVRLMASTTGRKLMEINAVSAKVAQLRELVDAARAEKEYSGGQAVVAFVDEIYHFNKSQQNALLPSVEKGDIILVGTTTENPYFEINKTLLSRMVIFELHPLEKKDLISLLERALCREEGLGDLQLQAEENVLDLIAAQAGGDARQALTRLELSAHTVAARGAHEICREDLEELLPSALLRFDRASDDHYDIISALIKSMRGSDPDAAVYWLGKLVVSGENLRFITRRLMIFAAEDIGLADPQALSIAASAAFAADMVGYPEARIILSEAVLYLATAPKSNSSYTAISAAERAIRGGQIQEVPPHLKQGGEGYCYPHDDPRHWVPQKYMEENLRLFFPGEIGQERLIRERLKNFWRRFREE